MYRELSKLFVTGMRASFGNAYWKYPSQAILKVSTTACALSTGAIYRFRFTTLLVGNSWSSCAGNDATSGKTIAHRTNNDNLIMAFYCGKRGDDSAQ
jgi:hypothetical protein